MYDLDTGKYVKSNFLNIADIGDIDVDPTHPNNNQNNITKSVYQIRKNSFPLVCGGDHAITYGSFKGCHKYMKEMYPDYELSQRTLQFFNHTKESIKEELADRFEPEKLENPSTVQVRDMSLNYAPYSEDNSKEEYMTIPIWNITLLGNYDGTHMASVRVNAMDGSIIDINYWSFE